MTSDSKEPVVTDEVPAEKPKIPASLILSGLLALLLVAFGVGTFMHFRQIRALQAELQVVKSELKKKDQSVDEMSAQLVSLSSQMNVLKDYSVARSGASGEKNSKNECAPVVPEVHPTVESPEAKGKTHAFEPPAVLSSNKSKHEPASKSNPGDALPRLNSPSEAKNKAPVPEPAAAPIVTKSKPVRQDCELVGKSPEEQAETLKRCVSLIDPPSRKAGSR